MENNAPLPLSRGDVDTEEYEDEPEPEDPCDGCRDYGTSFCRTCQEMQNIDEMRAAVRESERMDLILR